MKLKKRKGKKLGGELGAGIAQYIDHRVSFRSLTFFIFILVLLDQATKAAAAFFVPIFCNSGVAFGISGGGLIFSFLILALVLFMMREERSRLNLFALSLVFAGGFSNFIDRVVFGCVRDFIQTFAFFPVFNFADVLLTAGVLSFVYFVYLEK